MEPVKIGNNIVVHAEITNTLMEKYTTLGCSSAARSIDHAVF